MIKNDNVNLYFNHFVNKIDNNYIYFNNNNQNHYYLSIFMSTTIFPEIAYKFTYNENPTLIKIIISKNKYHLFHNTYISQFINPPLIDDEMDKLDYFKHLYQMNHNYVSEFLLPYGSIFIINNVYRDKIKVLNNHINLYP